MNILACFKTARDVDGITPRELRALRDGELDAEMFRSVLGGYDEAALENALRLADAARSGGAQGGEAVVLHAVTVGGVGSGVDADLFAIGFDAVFRIPASDRDASSPDFVAAAIARFIADRGGYDAVFTGKQAFPGESGQTPFLLAARCGLPCVPGVIDVRLAEQGLETLSRADAGECRRVVTRPAVFAMGEAAHPFLRVATLREKLRARGRTAEEIPPLPVMPVMGSGRRLRYIHEPHERQCSFIEGGTLEEKTRLLWEHHLRGAAQHAQP